MYGRKKFIKSALRRIEKENQEKNRRIAENDRKSDICFDKIAQLTKLIGVPQPQKKYVMRILWNSFDVEVCNQGERVIFEFSYPPELGELNVNRRTMDEIYMSILGDKQIKKFKRLFRYRHFVIDDFYKKGIREIYREIMANLGGLR